MINDTIQAKLILKSINITNNTKFKSEYNIASNGSQSRT